MLTHESKRIGFEKKVPQNAVFDYRRNRHSVFDFHDGRFTNSKGDHGSMTPRYILTDLRTDHDYVRATLAEVQAEATRRRLTRYQITYFERADAAGVRVAA